MIQEILKKALAISLGAVVGANARYAVSGLGHRWQGQPLYEAILQRLRQEKIAGCTVLRGLEGFGAKSHVHTARILRLSEDLPILIEIADKDENIRRILPILDEMVTEGLFTMEKAEVIKYSHAIGKA